MTKNKLNMLTNCQPIVQTRKGVFSTTPNAEMTLKFSDQLGLGNWVYYNLGLLYQENWTETWFTQILNP